MKIIGNATLVTLGENHQVIQNGAVAYDEEKIYRRRMGKDGGKFIADDKPESITFGVA